MTVVGAKKKRRTAAVKTSNFGPEVGSFFARIGLDTSASNEAIWDRIEMTLGPQRASELDEVLTSPHSSQLEQFEAIWADVPSALVTYGLVAGKSRAWLNHLKKRAPVGRRVLDVGCGIGVHTMFLAEALPESTVVGVDLLPKAIAVAEELSDKLGLSNTKFEFGDINDIDSEEMGAEFDLITGATLIHDVDPPLFLPIEVDAARNGLTDAVLANLGSARSRYAVAIAELLESNGVYIGMERCATADQMGSLLGAFHHAGLESIRGSLRQLDVQEKGHFDRPQERIPVFEVTPSDSRESLATSDHPHLLEQIAALYSDLAIELAFESDPPVRRIGGLSADFYDQDGIRRIRREEILELKSSQKVLYLGFSNGYRSSEPVPSNCVDESLRELMGTAEEMSDDPNFVEVNILGAKDLDRPEETHSSNPESDS